MRELRLKYLGSDNPLEARSTPIFNNPTLHLPPSITKFHNLFNTAQLLTVTNYFTPDDTAYFATSIDPYINFRYPRSTDEQIIVPLRGGHWHTTDRAKVHYAWHELGIILNKRGLNPAHRKANLLRREIWHGYDRSLKMLQRPPIAAKLRISPTNVKLELKVKILNLRDGPIVTNKGTQPRQTTTGP